MLDKLSSGLKKALEKVTRSGYIDEDVVEELVRDIQRALLSGDVDVELVFDLTEKIKKRGLEEKPKPGLTAREHVVNIVYEELVKILGKEKKEVKSGDILVIGLFGSGKTTSIGKLSKYFQKRGLKVGVVGCDIHREAAMDQISQIAEKLNIPCYSPKDVENAAKIAEKGLKEMETCDTVIFDSSGRDALDKELAKELRKLEEVINPEEVLLTIPADLGQSAGKQAKRFNELIGITGIILTKMDASAKGGGALTSSNITEAPIKFIGTGEGIEDLEEYNPERFVSRLIGFGDLKSLIEKAKGAGMEEKAEKMMKGDFTLEDFYEQIESVKGMGSLSQIVDMIPGFKKSKLPDDFMNIQEEKMDRFKYIIDSMTPKEKIKPSIINSSRVSRIAKGSGTSEKEVKELLKMYKQSKKVMKMFKGGKPKRGSQIKQMMKQFGLK